MSDNGWDECCSFRPPGHHVEYHPPGKGHHWEASLRTRSPYRCCLPHTDGSPRSKVTTEFCRMAERDTMKSVQGCQEQFGSSDTFLVLTAKAQSEARETANRPGTRSATERGQVGLSSGIRSIRSATTDKTEMKKRKPAHREKRARAKRPLVLSPTSSVPTLRIIQLMQLLKDLPYERCASFYCFLWCCEHVQRTGDLTAL
ncbi:hypothetical protein TGPRC2_290923 [Toxoplasma gondii TgCatPRC2]|uniref:Uncharacterized protein n=3 Tax=Toxoplasma gondii TaxID=5811 RepID=A0A151HK01_TOXGO|nr:hypothetical protein TGME49_290923 [Toxoplasma gondii ME49]EPT28051.1 hypothetical protein TGME49_290923 [Toxoplasma gondii ME49]KYF45010.1 hypothetical protein TGARI_290923 [Toxoplasma gondii ARI]KYK69685.1 hypothetical protein TGPRC2_290923 [Toxoplasma gondii TgCatPRC2]|eukprot:XP_018636449.1 hypothetical protein TGME49_290923 [Toxoplasma gondii ME49]